LFVLLSLKNLVWSSVHTERLFCLKIFLRVRQRRRTICQKMTWRQRVNSHILCDYCGGDWRNTHANLSRLTANLNWLIRKSAGEFVRQKGYDSKPDPVSIFSFVSSSLPSTIQTLQLQFLQRLKETTDRDLSRCDAQLVEVADWKDR
jgi:hypothetical protein